MSNIRNVSRANIYTCRAGVAHLAECKINQYNLHDESKKPTRGYRRVAAIWFDSVVLSQVDGGAETAFQCVSPDGTTTTCNCAAAKKAALDNSRANRVCG